MVSYYSNDYVSSKKKKYHSIRLFLEYGAHFLFVCFIVYLIGTAPKDPSPDVFLSLFVKSLFMLFLLEGLAYFSSFLLGKYACVQTVSDTFLIDKVKSHVSQNDLRVVKYDIVKVANFKFAVLTLSGHVEIYFVEDGHDLLNISSVKVTLIDTLDVSEFKSRFLSSCTFSDQRLINGWV